MTFLLDVLDVVDVVGDPSQVDVTGVEHDSRAVVPGTLFCCLPGAESDGHDHAPAAVRRGAVALLCERELPPGTLQAPGAPGAVVQALVRPGTVRSAMARAAAAWAGHPSEEITVVGVTGTNGKTTVSHLVAAILETAGTPTAVIGTLSGARTTPESPELQRRLAQVRDAQRAEGRRRAVSMEVSSHALAQGRVDQVRFAVAVFTNLGHDHLDFHGSMEAYFAAKASLFTPERADRAVVVADDAWGVRLARSVTIPVTVVRAGDAGAVRAGPGWTTFTWRGRPVRLRLTGAVNVVNALAAAEAATVLGVDPDAVVAGLGAAPGVPGRMEVVAAPPAARCTVLVDFAHTPDALEVALRDARSLVAPGGRLFAVFGAGGERDPGKRPQMGAVAAAAADLVVLTSDNPRREDPEAIIAGIASGAQGAGPAEVSVVVDRRQAIAAALDQAAEGDVVVVAGKGHETVQHVGDLDLPFNDAAVVAELLGCH